MVEWFNRTPGSIVHQGQDDPTMLLIDPDGKPDWVRVPDELGGGQFRCTEVRPVRCPVEGHEHQVRMHVLEGTDLCCLECSQFLWCRRPKKEG